MSLITPPVGRPSTDPVGDFVAAARAAGLDVDVSRVDINGPAIQRCPVLNKKNNRDGWFRLYQDGDFFSGVFGNWSDAESQTVWQSAHNTDATPGQIAARRARAEEARQERLRITAEMHAQARKNAAQYVEEAQPEGTPYLHTKGVQAHGVGADSKGRLVVPLMDEDGVLHTIEWISPGGKKQYMPGGRKTGAFFPFPDLETLTQSNAVLVCEGWATGASLHEATGLPVAAAGDAGNLTPVSVALRKKMPSARIVIAADDDRHADGNPGMQAAAKAAQAARAEVLAPKFQNGVGSDWNDLHSQQGLDAVREQLAGVIGEADGPEEPRGLIYWVSADVWAGALSAPDYVIDGVIESNTLNHVFGQWGSGKSLVELDQSCHGAHGMAWQGHAIQSDPFIVAYVIAEGLSGFKRRIAAWHAMHGQPISNRLIIIPQSVLIGSDEYDEALRATLLRIQDARKLPIRLIKIDTLARNFGAGDEDKNADMARFVNSVQRYAIEPTGAATTLIHHPGHGAKSRGRGGSALPGAADTEWQIERAGDVITMSNTKMKDGDPPGNMCWRIEAQSMSIGSLSIGAPVAVATDAIDTAFAESLTGVMGKCYGVLAEMHHAACLRLLDQGRATHEARIDGRSWSKACVEKGIVPNNDNHRQYRDRLVKAGAVRREDPFFFPLLG